MTAADPDARQRRAGALEGALATTGARLSFRPARETLDELGRLPEDWDSYGARPPTAVAISAAHGLLATVAEHHAEAADAHALPWATAPLADGGVQFEWRGPGGALEVEISPTGGLGYVVERAGSPVRRSVAGTAVDPTDVLDALGGVLGR